MIYNIVGVGKRRKGIAKKTGRDYDMTPIYAFVDDPEVEGQKTEEIVIDHLSRIQWPQVSLGDQLNIEYNRGGFVVSVTKIPDPFDEPPNKK